MGAPAPNFLSSSRALSNFMRLSLKKAAHAALSNAAKQEIRSVRGALSSTFPQWGERRCCKPNCLAAFVHYNLFVLDLRLGCRRSRRSRRSGAGQHLRWCSAGRWSALGCRVRRRALRREGCRDRSIAYGLDRRGDVSAVWSLCNRRSRGQGRCNCCRSNDGSLCDCCRSSHRGRGFHGRRRRSARRLYCGHRWCARLLHGSRGRSQVLLNSGFLTPQLGLESCRRRRCCYRGCACHQPRLCCQ
jgi:hypothetical protein